ncbi:hypothetical protein MFIFM68171_02144 [Madurella fahalii]|uniref:HTH psq-type domain-containing protein n=1 Tax=Madurella fahalii TaxID=1157608 RepID=A0ABQ0G2J3_9PEZI
MANKSDTRESQIQLAIAALRAKKVSSIRKAASLFGVPRGTLQDRFNGKHLPPTMAYHPEQRLTPAEEDSVVKAVSQLDAWGWPITIDAIRNFAM